MFIQKNGEVLNVTRGAYLSLFQSMGWEPAKGSTAEKKTAKSKNFMAAQPDKKSKPESEKEKTGSSEIPFGNMIDDESDFDEDDDDYEVVLEEMTIKELVEYAEEHDINLEGATKKVDIIGIIEAVEEE